MEGVYDALSIVLWLSYALDTEKLIANAPVDGDVITIDTFENAATDGAFEFTVNVKDIAVGDGALEANIKKVFDIEGVGDLATGTFSADAVEVNAAAAEGGKVKFTMTPKGGENGGLGTSRAGPCGRLRRCLSRQPSLRSKASAAHLPSSSSKLR